jgi:hypothetical protein
VYHKRHFAARRPNTAEGTDPLCDSSTVNIAALGLERQDHDHESDPPAYPSSSNRFRQNGKRISVPRLQFGVDWIARRGARVLLPREVCRT